MVSTGTAPCRWDRLEYEDTAGVDSELQCGRSPVGFPAESLDGVTADSAGNITAN